MIVFLASLTNECSINLAKGLRIGKKCFKIEEIATKHKIPLFAIVVRQSLKEALAPMTDAVRGSVDEVLKRIKRLVSERTKAGDKIMIVGVGNTIGVA